MRHPVVRIEQESLGLANMIETFPYTDDPLIIDLGSRRRDTVQKANHHTGQKAGDPRIGDKVGFSRACRRHAPFPVSVRWA